MKKLKEKTHEYYLFNFGSLTIPLKDIFCFKPLGCYMKHGKNKIKIWLIILCKYFFTSNHKKYWCIESIILFNN
jgi:hypothetical protein